MKTKNASNTNENNSDEYYYSYSKYLTNKYGEKVYKLPIDLNLTCPNRDGTISRGGCIFCGDEGGSFETLDSSLTIKEQVRKNRDYISKKYKAKKFISYFQTFCNTYMNIDSFKKMVHDASDDDIVGISISTRPDLIKEEQLNFLEKIQMQNIDITIELGLQTCNYKTLKILNRGHGLAEYIDAVLRLHNHGIRVCTHTILDLPWDNDIDTIETAKIISSLGVEEVKLHSLYVINETALARMFLNKEVQLMNKEDYIRRAAYFLAWLKPNIVVQRIIGRAPKENTLFCNWGESWWKIKDEILEYMHKNKLVQGCKYQNLKGGIYNG